MGRTPLLPDLNVVSGSDRDSSLSYTVSSTANYYIGVSSYSNLSYDPNTAGSGSGGGSNGATGAYTLTLTVTEPTRTLAINDVTLGPAGTPHYPVPWAREASTSCLRTAEVTRKRFAQWAEGLRPVGLIRRVLIDLDQIGHPGRPRLVYRDRVSMPSSRRKERTMRGTSRGDLLAVVTACACLAVISPEWPGAPAPSGRLGCSYGRGLDILFRQRTTVQVKNSVLTSDFSKSRGITTAIVTEPSSMSSLARSSEAVVSTISKCPFAAR